MSALTPDEAILGLLATNPQHGYQLLDAFHKPAHLGKVWSLSTSQLYAVLKRLERQGWIRGLQVESDNAPTRTEYAVTQEGTEHLNAWINEPHPSASIRRVRVEFLSRLYIARRLERPLQPIIDRQLDACRKERLRLVRGQDENARGDIGWLASELVIAQLEAVLEWLSQSELTSYPTRT